MGTSASITVKTKKGLYTGIYLHWDGHPEHCLATLRKHYTTYAKAMELVNLGNLSSLGNRVAPNQDEEHSFNNPIEDVTVAYIRDRDEPVIQNRTQLAKRWEGIGHQGYNYIFSGGKWDVVEVPDKEQNRTEITALYNEENLRDTIENFNDIKNLVSLFSGEKAKTKIVDDCLIVYRGVGTKQAIKDALLKSNEYDEEFLSGMFPSYF